MIGEPAAQRGGAGWEQIALFPGVLETSRGTPPPRASPSDWSPTPQPPLELGWRARPSTDPSLRPGLRAGAPPQYGSRPAVGFDL